jgi:hypothetical protein
MALTTENYTESKAIEAELNTVRDLLGDPIEEITDNWQYTLETPDSKLAMSADAIRAVLAKVERLEAIITEFDDGSELDDFISTRWLARVRQVVS